MDRKELVKKVYQSGHLLTIENEFYHARAMSYLDEKLKRDIGKGDITARLVAYGIYDKAIIKAKQAGIIAGLEEVVEFYKKNDISATASCKDGDKVESGEEILLLEGRTYDLLVAERTGLNFLQMMSGIATNTKKYVDISSKYHVAVSSTRKESIDELLEKKAVFVGGGYTHRLGLDGFVLIKDNHLTAMRNEGIICPISTAIDRIHASDYCGAAEIEVTAMEEALLAAKKFKAYGGLDGKNIPIIMLDNMAPKQIKNIIDEIKRYALIELSGNIELDNIEDYAELGADVISTSKLNCDARKLDLSQKILRRWTPQK